MSFGWDGSNPGEIAIALADGAKRSKFQPGCWIGFPSELFWYLGIHRRTSPDKSIDRWNIFVILSLKYQ